VDRSDLSCDVNFHVVKYGDKMDTSKVVWVVCLALVIALGIPAALYVAYSHGNQTGWIEMLQRAAGRARQPWQGEDNDLAELSRRVNELRGDKPREEKTENEG
jgi:hypothetical protein